jgi:hypothetical protein
LIDTEMTEDKFNEMIERVAEAIRLRDSTDEYAIARAAVAVVMRLLRETAN